MRTVTSTVYEATDGKVFVTEKECLEYEEHILNRTKMLFYYSVLASADTTEGRGFMSRYVFAVEHTLHYEAVLDYCFRHLGPPIVYVQGVAATQGWSVKQVDKDDWRIARGGQGGINWGGCYTPPGTIFLSDSTRLLPGFPTAVPIRREV